MSNNNFKITHGLEVANGITVAAGGLNIVGGSITLPSELQIGAAADKVRFPNTSVSISNITLDTKPSELHNIGLLAEGLASNTDISTYGIGVYGVGYTANDTRSSGVVGEGHVSDTSDTGSSVGVRGYSLDAHTGGANIGLYGNAANGLTNYALYMAVGDIYSGSEQHWTMSGDLTFTGSHTVTIPSLALVNPLPVTSGGTGVTTSTGTGNVVLSTSPTLVTPVLGDATATTINKVTLTEPANGSTITVLDGKSLTVDNSLTFTGVDSSSVAFGTGGTVVYTANKLSALSSTSSSELAGVISDETGTGALVFANTPALTSPAIATSLTTGSTSFDLVNTTATTVNLAGAATILNVGASTGTTTINNDLVVSGSITFSSGTTQISTTVINVDDPLIHMAYNNPADSVDIGLIGAYKSNVNARSGFVRDASDKTWKIFSGVTAEPVGNVMDFTGATYDDLKIGGLHATTGSFSSTVSATQLTSTIATGTEPFVVTSTTPVANLSIGGNAATVTTNANLTGVITSVGNATSIASQTGTGTKFVMNTSPTLVTPTLGAATATTINKVTITAPASSATLTLANGSSLVTSGAFSTTLTATADTNVTLPTSGTLVNTAVTTLSSLASVGTITTGTWSGNFGSVSGANLTSLTAGNLTGTIPSTVLGNSSVFIGSTSVALNRATAALSLTGVSIDGNAATVTTNANLTGVITSVGNATSIASKTGTGTKFVMDTSPTLVTPLLGSATATTINKVTITAPATGSTITVLDGKTLAVNNTLTFSGTDSSSVAFGTGGTVVYAANKLSALSATTSAELAGVISDETGTGALVFANTPTLVTPVVTTGLSTGSASFDLVNTNANTVNLAGAATTVNIGASTGNTTIKNNLVVTGNITFGSGTTQLSSTIIQVDDTLVYLAKNNTADILDIGFVGAYDNGKHTGLVRDHANQDWKLFSNVAADPGAGNTIDFTGATYDDLEIGGLHATTGTFSSTVSATQLTSTIATGTEPFVVTSTTPVANLSIGGNAATVTTNANLTGVITSVGNATSIASQTGTGTKFVMNTSPTLVTPVLGAATATTINKVTITAPASSATLTLANGSSLVTSGAFSTTLTATADTNITLPTSGTLVNTAVTTLSSLASVGTITTGTWSGNFGSVSGANLTSLTAGNLTGTIPSTVLGNSSVFIGSTSVALNRATGNLPLTGVSIDGNAATVTTNANLTGVITSVGNATSIASKTGTGTKFVMDTSPTLTGTPLAPTATAGTNTTQIATTEFVSSAVSTAVTTIDGGTY